MRKTIIAIMSLVAMVACTNDITVMEQAPSAISFENSFVENKTRAAVDPSITTATIDAFDVWGFMDDPNGLMFDAQRVTKGEAGWTYSPLQFWAEDHNYYFYAVAPVDNANIVVNKDLNIQGLGTIDFTNTDGAVDLLYAEKQESTYDENVATNGHESVKFTFAHLLSKIKFTFTNGFPEGTSSLKIEDLKISQAPSKGTVTLNDDNAGRTWAITENNATLDFGHVNGGAALVPNQSEESDVERLTIPADANVRYQIDFKVTLYTGSNVAMVSNKTVYLENQAFVIGKNYNITATIDQTNIAEEALKPIEFDVVEVEEWIPGDYNGNLDYDENGNPIVPEQPEEPATPVASEWGVVGDFTNWGGSADVVMYTTDTENLFVAKNVTIESGAFKVRANSKWDDTKNYGLEVAGQVYADKYYTVITGSGSQNITPIEYGTYDIYFDLNAKRVALMTPGKAYTEAANGGNPVVVVSGLKDHEWGLVGSFNDWDVANYVTTVVEGDWAIAKNVTLANGAEFKFAADKAWTLSYGSACDVDVDTTYVTYNNGGNMKFVGQAGAYDVYFSLVSAEFYMTAAAEEKEPVPGVVYTSVADFLAADVDDSVFYTLKGTITRVANTSYGNFDLTDETGTVYVYGLYSEDGVTSKYWAASGAKLGDDIVISAKRSEFNGSAQAGSARFVELLPGTLAFWTFSKDAVMFSSAAAEEVITVDAYNLSGDVTVSSDNAQFTATYADGALTISAKENTTPDVINGNITVTAGSLVQVITVAQNGVSVGGGTEVSASAVMAEQGWANSASVKEVSLDENVVVKFAQGKASNPPAYYTSGEAVRLYQNGATMTVSANGKTIKSMEIKFAQNHYYMAPNCGEFSAEGATRVWTGEATEVVFTTTGTDKNHRAYISEITVTYID
ncbi:MAG: fimbrillin family protein [Alistipes sp.]|nr:fimbrillin family protein [Alistipes sp.]